jgi:DNA polymerase-3 subunit gamma/tau
MPVIQFSKLYRPKNFNSVIGQDKAVSTLKGMLKRDKISPIILFYGAYGAGKTTLARIYAKHVCCLNYDRKNLKPCGKCKSCLSFGKGNSVDNHIYIHEINCSDSTGVDDVRKIINNARQRPIGKYRVYILDEAHKLSVSAQNCFLKELEEPPEHTIFLICTTDPQNLIPTFRSRCTTKLEMVEVSYKDIIPYLNHICEKEEVKVADKIIEKIAKSCNGHVRDAVGTLETVVNMLNNGDKVTEENIDNILENTSVGNPFKQAVQYLNGIYNGKYSTLNNITNLDSQGLFVLATKCIDGLHTEAMYSAINYDKLANKTKDFWKYKELNALVDEKVKKFDEKQKEQFVEAMSDMAEDLIVLIERLKNYGVGHNPMFLLVSFTANQVKRFKKIK